MTPEQREQQEQAVHEVGLAVRRARESAGWSQLQLAEALGVTQSAVAQWERGRTAPRAGDLLLAARALGVAPGELLPPR